jgi:aspartyl-tRNA(Asn)/glutamyl-tRNA(Gln) amidotransferase subunit A
MTDAELKQLTLANAIELVAQRKVSAEELVSAALSRIERLNPQVRAFITVIDDARVASHNPPLRGVPLSVKDLYDTAGIRTTAGAKVFADRVPADSANCVSRLQAAGATIVGKNNMHEFAFGVTTINPHYGAARNPWDTERISGGSSGGSASAVALGMGFASLGSDTGGSIRIPASLCGIVGLKPTYGRVSVRGVVPLSWSLDHTGPMTRTVQDAAILMEIIAGHDPLDVYSRDVSVPRYTEALTGNIKGVRVGVPKNYFFENISSTVDGALQKALRDLEQLGAQMVPIEMPGIAIHKGMWLQIASPEAYSFHESLLQKYSDQYGSDVRARLEPGRVLLSMDYVRAQRARTLLKQQCKKLFEEIDVIVTPTLPIVAPRIDDVHKPWGSGVETPVASLGRLARYFNLTGLPAISIPCGFTADSLPIGMQIAGKAFDEATVLRVAHAYEQNTRWFERHPGI